MEDDPIEEDHDPLEELSMETNDMIRKITQRMKCLEQEWRQLKKLKGQYANHLSHLQNSIVSRSFVRHSNAMTERLIHEIPNEYREITTQEEEEIVPTQICNQGISPTI